jgi:cytoskeletal protein CcmA (bactofilin family)
MWGTTKGIESQADGDHFTVLGKDVTFKGIVHFESTVRLDGCFDGEIHTKGMLIVGEHAVIRGTITVGTLISSGKIHGTVKATDKVQLLKSAVHIGDVTSPAFLIDEGAYFRGLADMGPGPAIHDSFRRIEALCSESLEQNEPRLLLPESDGGDEPSSPTPAPEDMVYRAMPH